MHTTGASQASPVPYPALTLPPARRPQESHEEHGGHDDHRRRLLRRLLAADDHGHDHGGETEETAPTVKVGAAAWTCVEEGGDSKAGSPLSKGEIWGLALLATFIVSAFSLIGLLLAFPFALRAIETSAAEVSAFAGGALIGGVLIHLLPEALAKPGAIDTMVWAVPTGFCASFALQLAAEATRRHTHRSVAQGDKEGTGAQRRWYHLSPLAFMIVFGDLWHNLSDGIVIAISFHSCSAATGWLVTAAIMLHELPQEISAYPSSLPLSSRPRPDPPSLPPTPAGDFAVLLLSGLSVPAAAAWNFISGLTAMIGCVAALIASDAASSSDASSSAIFIGSVRRYPSLHSLSSPPPSSCADAAAPVASVPQGMLLYIGATDVLPLALPHHQHSIHSHGEAGTATGEGSPSKQGSAAKAQGDGDGVEMKESSEHDQEHGHHHGHGHEGAHYSQRDAADLAKACEHAAPEGASLVRLALRAVLLAAGMGLVAVSTLWDVHCDV